jgi:Fe2+ or Zn2+ uptake regulation protein
MIESATCSCCKRSRQRESVKEAILGCYDHPTAEEVFWTVRATDPRISLATVYRNLDKLVDEGLVDKFVVPDQPDHYDPVRQEHYHARCLGCGRIFDIDMVIKRKMARLVRRQTGVEMTSLQIIAEGWCRRCKCKQGKEA